MNKDNGEFKGIVGSNGEINVDKTAQANPLPAMLPPAAYEFPWPAVRDFISMNISLMMAQQNLMIGEQMLAAGHPTVTEEKLREIRVKVREITEMLQILNARVEQGLISLEGKGPRLILPR